MPLEAARLDKEGLHPEKETTEALLAENRLFRPLPQLVVDANLNPKDYEEAVGRGKFDLEGFWGEAAEELDWFRPWDSVPDRSEAPSFRWFVGGKTNIAFNALDGHIATHRKNKEIAFQDKLPKTRSGKIMRRVLKARELGLKGIFRPSKTDWMTNIN